MKRLSGSAPAISARAMVETMCREIRAALALVSVEERISNVALAARERELRRVLGDDEAEAVGLRKRSA